MVEESELKERPDYLLCPLSNGLPKTGQTVSYAPCDDGCYQIGWDEGTRFIDNLDGTITDNATALMWPSDWSGVGAFGGATKIWLDAIEWSGLLSFGGYSDWRLPNANELKSLVDYGQSTPAWYSFVTNPGGTFYWTSTTLHRATAFAKIITTVDGNLTHSSKAATAYVVVCRSAC